MEPSFSLLKIVLASLITAVIQTMPFSNKLNIISLTALIKNGAQSDTFHKTIKIQYYGTSEGEISKFFQLMRKGSFEFLENLHTVAYIAPQRRNHTWLAYYLDNRSMEVT